MLMRLKLLHLEREGSHTNADRERVFDENRDRIMRIASAKYDVGIKQNSGPVILITFEDYSTRRYP
jgi:hypothetical protein